MLSKDGYSNWMIASNNFTNKFQDEHRKILSVIIIIICILERQV